MKPLLRAFRKVVVDGLISIYLRLTLATAKRIVRLRDFLMLVAMAECSEALDLPLVGEDVEFDRSFVRLAVRHFSEIKGSESDQQGEPGGILAWFAENAADLRKTSFQCQAWLLEKTKSEEKLEELRADYRG